MASEKRIEDLVEQLREQQISQLATVKQVSEEVKAQEIAKLRQQFDLVRNCVLMHACVSLGLSTTLHINCVIIF